MSHSFESSLENYNESSMENYHESSLLVFVDPSPARIPSSGLVLVFGDRRLPDFFIGPTACLRGSSPPRSLHQTWCLSCQAENLYKTLQKCRFSFLPTELCSTYPIDILLIIIGSSLPFLLPDFFIRPSACLRWFVASRISSPDLGLVFGDCRLPDFFIRPSACLRDP